MQARLKVRILKALRASQWVVPPLGLILGGVFISIDGSLATFFGACLWPALVRSKALAPRIQALAAGSGYCPTWSEGQARELLREGREVEEARACKDTQMLVWRWCASCLVKGQARWIGERPGLFDDPELWLQRREGVIWALAHRGFIDPQARFADVLGEGKDRESRATLGAPFDSPWPGDARLCDDLPTMARRLFESELGAKLAGRSQSAVQQTRLEEGVPPAQSRGAPRRL